MNRHKDRASAAEATIDVSGEGMYAHIIGNASCTEGWCGTGWPKKCRCGGLIHADFGDEDMDCDYWLHEKCDQCGEDFDEQT